MLKERLSNILLYLLIFIVMLSIILLKPAGDLDELWNYNFARNICNGLIPYRDFNMIITPLLSIICGIILKITFNELVVMRILASILCSLIFYMIYRLFRILNIKKEISIIFLFLIGYLFKDVLCIDYNYASLLVTLIIIYNEIKVYKQSNEFIQVNIRQDIFLGILAGLAITLKQTTGLFICIALLGNKLLFVKNKEDFNYYIKSFLYRMIGILISVGLMIIYLIINNALGDFVSYTIKGVSGFSNYISYKNLIKFDLIGILSILVPAMFGYEWIKTIYFEENRLAYIFLVYGLAMFVVCFPISNEIHFFIGALPIIILTVYEIYNISKKIINNISNKKVYKIMIDFIINFITIFIILFISLYSIINLYRFFKETDNFSNLKHFKYINISKGLEMQINIVNEYILKNDNVIILDASAAAYMIPIDRYNKDYDMFNKGNLGYKGEQKIIEQIMENNTQYLILKDEYSKNWQTPMDIIEYVKENKTKIGEIEIFDIYMNKRR